jgi:hypothetical protein
LQRFKSLICSQRLPPLRIAQNRLKSQPRSADGVREADPDTAGVGAGEPNKVGAKRDRDHRTWVSQLEAAPARTACSVFAAVDEQNHHALAS